MEKETLPREKQITEVSPELTKKFSEFNDLDAAHSVITWEIFEMGNSEDRQKIEKRLLEIKDPSIMDDALFQLAKRYYEIAKNLEKAKEIALKIKNQDEMNRCLVHLAEDILDMDANIGKADWVMRNYNFERKKEFLEAKENKKDGHLEFVNWLMEDETRFEREEYLKYYIKKREEVKEKLTKQRREKELREDSGVDIMP